VNVEYRSVTPTRVHVDVDPGITAPGTLTAWYRTPGEPWRGYVSYRLDGYSYLRWFPADQITQA
jgi:hypothetical protein